MSIIDRPLRALKLLDQPPARGKTLIDRDHLSCGREHDGARYGQHAKCPRDFWLARRVDLDHADDFRTKVCLERLDRWRLGGVAGSARRGRETDHCAATVGLLAEVLPCLAARHIRERTHSSLIPSADDDDGHGNCHRYAQQEQQSLDHLGELQAQAVQSDHHETQGAEIDRRVEGDHDGDGGREQPRYQRCAQDQQRSTGEPHNAAENAG